MCQQCNYRTLLESRGLDSTPRRLEVLETIGAASSPLSARQIFEALRRRRPINRVTVYRILDLLAAGGLVEKLSTGGGRAHVYGPAPSENHPAHPHFFCKRCGRIQCLPPHSIPVDLQPVRQNFAGCIENVTIQVQGVCQNCLAK